MLRIDEVCEALAVSRATLYRLMDTGDLPYCRVGSLRRVSVASVNEFVDRHRVGGLTPGRN